MGCDTCRDLILAGDREGLVERSIEVAIREKSILSFYSPELVRLIVPDDQGDYWASATGESTPIR